MVAITKLKLINFKLQKSLPYNYPSFHFASSLALGVSTKQVLYCSYIKPYNCMHINIYIKLYVCKTIYIPLNVICKICYIFYNVILADFVISDMIK